MSDDEQTFRLKYKIEFKTGNFTREEIIHSGQEFGGADAFCFCPIVYDDKGSANYLFVGLNGSLEQDPYVLLKAWIVLTRQMAESAELPPSVKVQAQTCWREIEQALGETVDKGFH